MHRRISTTLNTLRQDLAAKLGCDFIHHACRQAGHSWCDSCLLTPAAIIHWFLIQVLHGNTALGMCRKQLPCFPEICYQALRSEPNREEGSMDAYAPEIERKMKRLFDSLSEDDRRR